jgi:hypothetical protein
MRKDRRETHRGSHNPDDVRGIILSSAAILGLLAGYQVAEVAICAHPRMSGFLPRFAFLIVTWLPPLGWLLIAQVHRPRERFLYAAAYGLFAVAAGNAAWILVDPAFASASVCNAVFAHYAHAMPRFVIYGAFYWSGLLGMLLLSAWSARRATDLLWRRMAYLIWVGTAGFVVPSLLVTQFVPPARGALPSIMCHFALVLAISLARMLWLIREPCMERASAAEHP